MIKMVRRSNAWEESAFIGHEFTHVRYAWEANTTKDGNRKNWWTDEDRAAFKERTDKVAAYYDQIEVLPDITVDGELTIGETVANLGGIACMDGYRQDD